MNHTTHDDKCERCGECLGCAGIPSPCEPREGMIELHQWPDHPYSKRGVSGFGLRRIPCCSLSKEAHGDEDS